MPGVVAVRTGGVGNLTAVYVRGGESTYNKVLLDGIPLNEPGGSFNFATLVAREHRAHRSAARRALGAVRIRRDGKRHSDLHRASRGTAGLRLSVTADGGNYDTAHIAAGVGATVRRCRSTRCSARSLHTDNREPNNEHDGLDGIGHGDTLDDVGCVGAVPRARRVRRDGHSRRDRFRPARHGRASSSITTASFLGGWNQPLGSRVTQQASYSYIDDELPFDQPDRRSALHGRSLAISSRRFRRRIFSTTPKRDLERHHFEYRADADMGRSQTLTAAFAYDGERGVLTDHRSTAAPQRPDRNNTGTTVQYEARAGARLVRRRRPIREQRQLRLLRRAARWPCRGWPHSGNDERRRHTASRQRRARHQGADASSSRTARSAVFSAIRISSRNDRADSTSASSSGSRAIGSSLEADLFRESLRRSHQPRAVRSRHFQRDSTRTSARRARPGSSWPARRSSAARLRIHGAYTYLDSKVIRSTSSSPIFAPGQPLYRRPRPFGLGAERRTRADRVSLRSAASSSDRASTPTSISRPCRSNEGYATWNASGEVRVAHARRVSSRSKTSPIATTWSRSAIRALGRTVRAGIRTRF